MSDSIKVAVEVSKGIAVHARGTPAKIVAVGAAAGVVFVALAAGYGAFEGSRFLIARAKRLLETRRSE